MDRHFYLSVTVGSVLLIVAGTLYTYLSPQTTLAHTSNTAISEFKNTVELAWPTNKTLVLEKLEKAESTYKEGGGNDPLILGEFDRLHAWILAATSVADQRQFLSEVREHSIIVYGPLGRLSGEQQSVMIVCLIILASMGWMGYRLSLKTQTKEVGSCFC